MNVEKYGFVYIWRDKKRKMCYIGCHWGTTNDGYICSSARMRKSYRRRPKDFRRKILQHVYTNREDLLEVEHQWLQLIPDEELGKKYYNQCKHKFGHWTEEEKRREEVAKKIRQNIGRAKISKKLKGNKNGAGHKCTEETRNKISKSQKGRKDVRSKEGKERHRIFMLGRTPWNKDKKTGPNPLAAWNKGQKTPKEVIEKQRASMLNYLQKHPRGKMSEEQRQKLSIVHTGKCWSPKRRLAYENKYGPK